MRERGHLLACEQVEDVYGASAPDRNALAIDPDLSFSRAMYALTRFENSSAVNATTLLEQAWREQRPVAVLLDREFDPC